MANVDRQVLLGAKGLIHVFARVELTGKFRLISCRINVLYVVVRASTAVPHFITFY